MNFTLGDDQILLRDTAQAFLRKEVRLDALLVPGATVRDAGYDGLWQQQAALGWPAMAVPEAFSGLGMSLVDLALLAAECGRFLAASPLFGTLAGSFALLAAGSEAQKARWLGAVAEGSLRLALAIADLQGGCEPGADDVRATPAADCFRLSGARGFVVDAPSADQLLVAARHEGRRRFFRVERGAPGLALEPLAWRDITREVAHLRLDDAPAELLDGPDGDAWPWVRDRMILLLAAESAGGLQAVLQDTTAYAKEREAFGRPIGAYQAIKHSLADMLAQSECAWTAVLYAAWALSESHPDGPLAAAMAQSYASEAYREATHRGIQIFGAIGFTWEMKNHLYFKRARCNAELLGAPVAHRERVVRILEERAGAAAD